MWIALTDTLKTPGYNDWFSTVVVLVACEQIEGALTFYFLIQREACCIGHPTIKHPDFMIWLFFVLFLFSKMPFIRNTVPPILGWTIVFFFNVSDGYGSITIVKIQKNLLKEASLKVFSAKSSHCFKKLITQIYSIIK